MRTREHLPHLDGLRAVAIVLVLWQHLRMCVPAPDWAWAGVDLFFVLSGFLITRNLLYDRERGIGLRRFWMRRAARIFPPALACLAAVGLLMACDLLPSEEDDLGYAAAYVYNLAMPFGVTTTDAPLGHFWSLGVEEQFYLAWPVLVALLPLAATTNVARFGAMAAAAAMLLCGTLLDPADAATYPVIRFQLFTRGWPLFAGAAIACAEPWLRESPRRPLAFAFGIAVTAAAAHRWAGPIEAAWGVPSGSHGLGTLVPQLTALAGFMATLSPEAGGRLPVLRHDWTQYVGRISYELYLWHMPVYYVLGARVGTQVGEPAAVPLVLLVSFAVAAAAERWIGRPAIAYERRLEGRAFVSFSAQRLYAAPPASQGRAPESGLSSLTSRKADTRTAA